MTPAVTQLEEIHAQLTHALEDPRTIGLRKGAVPQPLDDLLRSVQCALGQLLIEIREEGASSNLEAELSQDADR